MIKNIAAIIAAGFISNFGYAGQLTAGKTAPSVSISGYLGGYVKDSSEFKVEDLKGKMQIIWYVDPDEKDLNEYAVEELRSASFPKEIVGSVAIINFDATVIPNFILGGVIEDSQKENKNTIYVKDMEKTFIKEWGLKDNSSNVIVLAEDLKVLYWFGGKLNKEETQKMLAAVRKHNPKLK
jgi:predicted transcriptional regulator